MKSAKKKPAAKKATATKPAPKAAVKKKVAARGAKAKASSAKATKASAAKPATKKKPAAKKTIARKPAPKVAVKKMAVKPARPVAKTKAAQPAKPKATQTRNVPVPARASKQPQAKTLEQPTPEGAAMPVAETANSFDAHVPDATFDPTPDTNVPMRGHTSFKHNVQSERVAALKGQRSRMTNHRKR